MCFIFMGGFGLLDFEMFYDCCVFLCVFLGFLAFLECFGYLGVLWDF
jgi:hypothetical protein